MHCINKVTCWRFYLSTVHDRKYFPHQTPFPTRQFQSISIQIPIKIFCVIYHSLVNTVGVWVELSFSPSLPCSREFPFSHLPLWQERRKKYILLLPEICTIIVIMNDSQRADRNERKLCIRYYWSWLLLVLYCYRYHIYFLFFSLLENNVLLLNKKSIEYKDIPHAIKNIFILLLLKSFSLSRKFLNNFPPIQLTIFLYSPSNSMNICINRRKKCFKGTKI